MRSGLGKCPTGPALWCYSRQEFRSSQAAHSTEGWGLLSASHSLRTVLPSEPLLCAVALCGITSQAGSFSFSPMRCSRAPSEATLHDCAAAQNMSCPGSAPRMGANLSAGAGWSAWAAPTSCGYTVETASQSSAGVPRTLVRYSVRLRRTQRFVYRALG